MRYAVKTIEVVERGEYESYIYAIVNSYEQATELKYEVMCETGQNAFIEEIED